MLVRLIPISVTKKNNNQLSDHLSKYHRQMCIRQILYTPLWLLLLQHRVYAQIPNDIYIMTLSYKIKHPFFV